jgi:hypothetical protein
MEADMHLIVWSRFNLAGCALAMAITTAPLHAADPSSVLPATPGAQLPQSASPLPATTSPSPSTAMPQAAQRPFIPSRVTMHMPAGAPGTQPRYAPGYFGGSASRASLSQVPRRRAIQPAPPQPMRGPTKPFETIYREPTISPYLNLYREEDDAEGAPNYHTFVRPYQQQIETNRLQQRELQRLRGQVQGLSTTTASPQYGDASLPATGTRSRYMDTAQFYGTGRR